MKNSKLKKCHIPHIGVPRFSWTESLKFQFTSLGSGLLPHNDRHRCRSIPNLKIHKNKKYWIVDFEYTYVPVRFDLPALLEEEVNTLLKRIGVFDYRLSSLSNYSKMDQLDIFLRPLFFIFLRLKVISFPSFAKVFRRLNSSAIGRCDFHLCCPGFTCFSL